MLIYLEIKKEKEKMRAFYFAPEDNRLRYGDGREIVVGETHTVDATPECCRIGLHASKRVIDALMYAPSPNLYIVDLGGEIDENDDKVSAQTRRYIANIDTTTILVEFAKRQALLNIELIKPYCSAEQYADILAFLKGDEEKREEALAAAWEAEAAAWEAEAAARAAAWAAGAAAEAAAWEAEAAAEAAAWEAEAAAWAAWAAGAAAARAAAWEAEAAARAARAAANDMLIDMIEEATGIQIEELE